MKNTCITKLLTGIVLIVTMSSPAFAVKWEQVGEGHYIDTDSIRESYDPGTYTFITKFMAKSYPLETINNQEVWGVKTKTYVDCRSSYAKMMSYIPLNQNYKAITPKRLTSKQWVNIDSGNVVYEPYSYVCREVFESPEFEYRNLWSY